MIASFEPFLGSSAQLLAACCLAAAASWVATFPLTLADLWSIFLAPLGDRLVVGRMTLDHATGVRILLPQPL